MERDDAAHELVTPEEGREASTEAGRQDTPDPPPPADAGVPRALFYLALVALVVLIAGYVNLHRRMNTLARGITDLQASVQDLPEATIEAIVNFQTGQAQEGAPQEQQATGRGVTIDDDAWIGDREQAQLAIVEFSDFNCPYCARFHQETLAHIIDTYVRDGRVLYVYRDFIGVGGQSSLAAASAAECVREQAGDEAYLTLVHALFSAQGRGSPRTWWCRSPGSSSSIRPASTHVWRATALTRRSQTIPGPHAPPASGAPRASSSAS